MMFVRRRIVNNITLEQQKAIQNIKNYFGEAKFEDLLKQQRTYIDDYFEKHYDDKDLSSVDANNDDSTEEKVEENVVSEENKEE